jgi:hypothetical protein
MNNAPYYVYVLHPATKDKMADEELIPCDTLEKAAAIYNEDTHNRRLLKKIEVKVNVEEV